MLSSLSLSLPGNRACHIAVPEFFPKEFPSFLIENRKNKNTPQYPGM
jgi:hypothetical protein